MFRIIILLLISINISAQSKTYNEDSTFNKFMKNKTKSFYDSHINKEFPKIGIMDDFNNTSFDFNNINQKTVIFFGFKNCPACHVIKKYFFDITKKYKKINFIYITFDGKETIFDDFSNENVFKLPNLKVFSFDRNFIDDIYLVQGYPQLFFINSFGIIKEIQIGAVFDVTKSKEKFMNGFKKIL
jgi:hypothetical protein